MFGIGRASAAPRTVQLPWRGAARAALSDRHADVSTANYPPPRGGEAKPNAEEARDSEAGRSARSAGVGFASTNSTSADTCSAGPCGRLTGGRVPHPAGLRPSTLPTRGRVEGVAIAGCVPALPLVGVRRSGTPRRRATPRQVGRPKGPGWGPTATDATRDPPKTREVAEASGHGPRATLPVSGVAPPPRDEGGKAWPPVRPSDDGCAVIPIRPIGTKPDQSPRGGRGLLA